jgi:CRISPR-associated protein Csx14
MMMLSSHEATLICTLGGQPQIVTFAMDYLLARAEPVRDVFVLHLSLDNPRYRQALERLRPEFDGDRYQGQPCRFRPVSLRQGTQTLSHIRTETEAEIVRQTTFNLVSELKRSERALHLCIAGGPRMLGLMALSAAQLLCGHQDKVWHMHTAPEFLEQARDGALMHDAGGRQVRLVQVPVVPWGAYLPQVGGGASLSDWLQRQTRWLDQTEHRRCRAVWDGLSDRERQTLRALAGGQTPQEAAEKLSLSVKTISTYTTKIYELCRGAWELPLDARLTYHFLWAKFSAFMAEV